jgi:hypothetical protein
MAGAIAAVGPSSDISANHANAPVELKIWHSGVCTPGAIPTCTGQLDTPLTAGLGQTFTVQGIATVNAPVQNGAQWLFVWQADVLDVGAPVPVAGSPTDLDTDFSSCAAPFELTGVSSGVEGLGGGCAAGTAEGTPIVSVPLTCVAEGTTLVALAGLDFDENFGSTLDTSLTTETVLEDQLQNSDIMGGATGAPDTVAAVSVTCSGDAPVPTATAQAPVATPTQGGVIGAPSPAATAQGSGVPGGVISAPDTGVGPRAGSDSNHAAIVLAIAGAGAAAVGVGMRQWSTRQLR